MGDHISIQSKYIYCQYFGYPAVKVKVDMVPLANAGSDPGAVVVVHRDAAVANAAVVHSRRFYDVARYALFTLDFIFVLLN